MLKKIGLALVALVITLFLTVFASSDGLSTFGQPPDAAELRKHLTGGSLFVDGKFQSKEPVMSNHHAGRFFQIAARIFFRPAGKGEPTRALPVEAIEDNRFAGERGKDIRITWLGHASILVEIEGYRILTDPNFSERASPFRWIGPKRFHPVPIATDKLPILDAIVISHDHYDHLDYDTIRKLAPRTKHFFVPLGVGSHLVSWGVDKNKITELDWWQETKLDNAITLAPTPAQHFSGRSLSSRNTTLWASWVILGKRHRIYFSGDTGMFDGFKDIGKRYGPFDYTLMHIGAYSDEWPKVHMTPEEAVLAHKQIGGKVFVPIHWGTFRLAFHDWNDPAERLYQAANKAKLTYVIPIAGQSFHNPGLPPVKPWWRNAG